MYEAKGFTSQFGARPGGRIVCFGCHFEAPAEEFELVSLSRTEGASDPDDMLAVAAPRGRNCGAPGTLVLNYGPEAGGDHRAVLKHPPARRTGPEKPAPRPGRPRTLTASSPTSRS